MSEGHDHLCVGGCFDHLVVCFFLSLLLCYCAISCFSCFSDLSSLCVLLLNCCTFLLFSSLRQPRILSFFSYSAPRWVATLSGDSTNTATALAGPQNVQGSCCASAASASWSRWRSGGGGRQGQWHAARHPAAAAPRKADVQAEEDEEKKTVSVVPYPLSRPFPPMPAPSLPTPARMLLRRAHRKRVATPSGPSPPAAPPSSPPLSATQGGPHGSTDRPTSPTPHLPGAKFPRGHLLPPATPPARPSDRGHSPRPS